MDIRAQVYEPNYEGSPEVDRPAGSRPRTAPMFKARAGHHLVLQQLSGGRNLGEELGR